MAERTVKFHLIHSIKGGCGKSANAYFLTLREGALEHTEDDCIKSKVCFVDADFRGSGLFSIYKQYPDDNSPKDKLYIKDWSDENGKVTKSIGEKKRGIKFYTDNILRNEDIYLNDVVEHVVYNPAPHNHPSLFNYAWGFDIALCNPGSDTKNAFITNTSHVDGNTINVSYFTHLFKDFLMQLAAKYDTIVLDMSPGKDEYTKSIFGIVYNMGFEKDVKKYCKDYKNSCEPQKIEVTLHLVTTRDVSHIETTANELVSAITERRHAEKGPNSIEVIINEPAFITTKVVTTPNSLEPYSVDVDEHTVNFNNQPVTGNTATAVTIESVKYILKIITDRIPKDISGHSIVPKKTLKYRPYIMEYDFKIDTYTHLLDAAKKIADELK